MHTYLNTGIFKVSINFTHGFKRALKKNYRFWQNIAYDFNETSKMREKKKRWKCFGSQNHIQKSAQNSNYDSNLRAHNLERRVQLF